MTEVDDLYLTVFWWTLGILGVAWVLLAGALLALRGRTVALPGGEGSRSTFDVAWAVAPAVIVMLVAVPAVRGTFTTEAEQDAPTGQIDADAATAASEQAELSAACCEIGRHETTTKEDDSEEDDHVD